MKLFRWKSSSLSQTWSTCCHTVTFAGGLGAQVLSLAALLDIESEGGGSVRGPKLLRISPPSCQARRQDFLNLALGSNPIWVFLGGSGENGKAQVP